MPLTKAKPGQEFYLKEVIGGTGVKKRLMAMGFVPGVNLSLASGGKGGPVVINLHNTKIAIGKGLASKIIVEQIE